MKPTCTHLVRLFVFFLFLSSLDLYAQIGSGIAPVNSPSSGFNIDGTLIANSSNGDWLDGTGTGGFVLANSGTPINTKTTYHLYDEYNSLTDNIFGGGDKVSDNPNNMTWVAGTANNKTDMNNALIHFTTDINGNVWFVFAADRLSNSGNAYIDFEFLQDEITKTTTGFATTASNSTGGRTEGDFLLTVYFESGIAKFDIQRWSLVSGVWQYKTYYSSLPVNSVYAAGNTTSIPVLFSAFGTNTYPQNTFIESAVNLTKVLGTIDPCANLKIKTIFVKSKTSTSPSSSIKDFFDPLAVSNLTLGSADAGDDDTVCFGGSYQLKGKAVPSPNYSVVSTTWSVINGSATIANPSQLNSYVTITEGSATLRLTVETHPTNGIGTHCIVYDDVIISSVPSPNCSITGAEGPICPSTTNSYSAPSGTTYLWSISGNATISGSTTSQTVNVVSGQNCNQSYTLSLETTNASSCTITCSKTISVIDTTAPVVTTSADSLNHTIECSNTAAIASALTEVPTATDNCSTTPTLHLVSDVTTADSNCANAYSRVRTWNFTDACGNSSSNFVQTISVTDTMAPIVTTTSGELDHTIECSNTSAIDAALTEVPTATDNCSTTPTLHLVSDVTIADSNCANAYSRVRTWNFTDACGNTSSNFVQTISVIDTTAPVFVTTSNALNHTIECSNTSAIDAALTEVPTATDNCSTTPTLHLVSDVTIADSNCVNAYSRVRTWNFTDACGNSSSNFVQTISVTDTTAPIVTTTSGELDHTIECSNTSAIDAALTEVPTATDNCSTTPTLHLVSDVTTADSNCANAYSRVRTWNFTDACGNTSSNFIQTISVTDTTAPIVTTTSGELDHTIECSNTSAIDAALTEVPTATDNCSTTPTLHLVSDVTIADSNCANAYSRVRTWNFTDACGNTSSNFVQTISVIDTTAPVLVTTSNALNHTIECSNTAAIASALTEIPTATDNCSTTPTLHLVSDVTTADSNCANAYSRVRTWNFTDACGNISSNFVQTISVIDTTDPTWTTLAGSLDSTIECSDAQALANAQKLFPVATDNCDADLSNIVKVTGTFVASGTCANTGTYTNTWTITDDCGNVSEPFTQIITIKDTTNPILLTQATDKIVECDGQGNKEAIANWLATNGGATASDNCSEIHWSNNFDSLPKDCSSMITVIFTATDDCENKTSTSATFSVQDTTPPVVPEAPTNITVKCSSDIPPMISLTAKDNCSGDLTVEGTNNIKNGDCKNSYEINRTWTFRDDCNNIATTSQTIIIEDNTAPVITSLPEPTTISCTATPQFAQPTATDECGYNKVNLAFNDVKTEGNCAGSYSITRTWTATDVCGNSSTASQTIFVEDKTAPVIANLPLPTTISCPNTPVFAFASAIDECGSDFSLTFNDVRTEGSCVGSYLITRTWTATDTCGNSATASQTIAVEDKTAPVIANLPAPTTINYPNTPEFVQATATDECSPELSLTFKDVRTDGNTINTYSITRTWTAIDACGNSATASQTINVENKTGPITTSEFNAEIVATCDAIPAKPELVFTSPCPTVTPAVFTETISNQTANSYTINRKWVATDICGNTSEFIQTVNITISNALTMVTGTVCNDGETTNIDLASLLPIGTPTNGTWTDVSNSEKLAGTILNAATLTVGDYIFEYTINNLNCPRKIQITITVTTDCGGIVLPCGTILVHNTFSPNGDGINDKFVIDNINDTNCYPDNTIEIYNRWGVLVYSTKGYNNTTNAFDGVSNGRSTVSQSSGLPTGTYFYILTYTSFDNNNSVQINKKEGYLFLTK